MSEIKIKKILILLSLFLFAHMATLTAAWAGANSMANKGNANYKKEDYSKAYEYYKKAEAAEPDNSKIKFNIGDTFYRLKDYESAAAFFEEAAKDKEIKALSFYNAGNANFKNQNMEEAAKNYRQAILLNPKDENAKHNLQLTLKKIKQQKNTCNKPQENDKNKQDQKNKKDDKEKKSNDKSKQKPKPDISKEQAERLLKMIKEKEKSSINPETMNLRMQKKGEQNDEPQGKDW
ncbi:MAG: tetratricopeptide repeat protein [Elusimicrobia bacterium]|nr:tetratricopeptide repeat protein [Elusimicrobiota bacterium]